jgi:hypothetical protein
MSSHFLGWGKLKMLKLMGIAALAALLFSALVATSPVCSSVTGTTVHAGQIVHACIKPQFSWHRAD